MMTSLIGPLWGRLGDRKGMRLLATRATAANSVFWSLMALAQNVYQLFVLRIVLGLFGGFNNTAVALVTQLAPKEKVPSIIGSLQSVQILSAAIGPFFGGILATSIGVRNTFIVTGIMNFVSLLSILFLYRDADVAKQKEKEPSEASGSGFWKRPEYFTALMILFFVNMADRTFGPIIPLFLEELGTPRAGLEMVAGALISVAAFGEAFSAWLSCKLASRVSLGRLLTGRLGLRVFVLAPMVFAHSAKQFSVLRVLLALLAGGTLTLALSAAHRVIPGEHRGTGFALLSGTSTFGGAAGPIISGAIAGFSIRWIFVFNSVVYLLMIGFGHPK